MKKPPTVVEGKVHKREEEPASRPIGADQDEVTASTESTEPISPARARATDQSVKRATHGLIRLESLRRLRHRVRRVFYATLILGAIAGLCYLFGGDAPMDWLRDCWREIEAKLIPVFTEGRIFSD